MKGLVQECVGGSELQQRKSKIQNFSDQTSSQLKKHVYANYMQFIETAKEISRKYKSNSMNYWSLDLSYRSGIRNVSTFTSSN